MRNEFYSDYDRLYFAVPDYDFLLVEALYQRINKERGETSRPMQILINGRDLPYSLLFLEAFGFEFILSCHCPEIDVIASLQKLSSLPPIPRCYRIKRYIELGEVQKKALDHFRVTGCLQTQKWNPTVERLEKAWEKIALTLQEEEASWAVFKDGQIVLNSDFILNDDCVWLGWGWHASDLEGHPMCQAVWAQILRLQLEESLFLGKRMFGEFDSTERYSQVKQSLLVYSSEIKERYYLFKQKSKVVRVDE
jgi:hypothetical protein